MLTEPTVRGFWKALWSGCSGDCDAVVIPHNSNKSNGLAFSLQDIDGQELTDADLELRARTERLVEVFQSKGSSECAPGIGTTDEECGFEQVVPDCQPGVEAGEDVVCARAGSFAPQRAARRPRAGI